MQSRIFQTSSRFLLLAALAVQIAFGAGTTAYCISTEIDSRIHVCSSPALCEVESQQSCAAATESQVPTSCCEDSSGEAEASTCAEQSQEECAEHYCSTAHSCNLVPNHLTSERQTEIQFSSHHISFIWQSDQLTLPSVSLRAIRGDSSPPRQIAELAIIVPRRGPPILS
jgi:hypothetical protein